MRKPLTVSLSVVCTSKGMSRWLIQMIKAMLLCIVYAMLLVDSVNIYRENIASTFWLITSLISDQFSIRLKFWKTSESGLFNCINSVSMHNIECFIFCIECHNLYQQCQHTQYLMVCLESPNSQFSKTFFRLKIG